MKYQAWWEARLKYLMTIQKTPADGIQLQKDTGTLDVWSEDWVLSFNMTKHRQLSIGHQLKKHYFIGKPPKNIKRN